MSKKTPNSTQFSKPHISSGNHKDRGREVVRSKSYGSNGKPNASSGEHHYPGSAIFEIAKGFFK